MLTTVRLQPRGPVKDKNRGPGVDPISRPGPSLTSAKPFRQEIDIKSKGG